MFKIEIQAWENEELGLIYLENRAFDENDNMVETFLDVVTMSGESFDLGNLIETNRGKTYMDDDYKEVTVDDVEWTFIEKVYDGYSDLATDKFINAVDYIK